MPTLDQLGKIAEIFESIAIGVGALLGGFGAFKILEEWQAKRRLQRLGNKWRKDFPKDKLGEDFRLLKQDTDPIYVCDSRSNLKHWIKNSYTLLELGFNFDQFEVVGKPDLDKYKMGDTIDLK